MLAQVIVSGLTAGAVYALIALGFVMIYKASGVMNFAQGQIVMVGAYFAVTLRDFGFSYPSSFVVSVAASAVLGMMLERLFFRPLIKAPESSAIIATVTIGIILENSVRLLWGSELLPVSDSLQRHPDRLGNRAHHAAGAVDYGRRRRIVFCAVCVLRVVQMGIGHAGGRN